MKSQYIYDEVSHEWDEQVDYLMLPQYKDCYILYPQHLKVSHYDTDNEILLNVEDKVYNNMVRRRRGIYRQRK